jgi:hypothetical protein
MGGIVWAFLPFVAFVVAVRFWSPALAFVAGAVVALGLVARSTFVQKQSPRILELGTALIFLGLTVYTIVAKPAWSVFAARLVVDIGLLLVIVVSIAIRRPFTLQYAREQVPQQYWSSPSFLRVNDIISGVWAVAFGGIVLCDCAVVVFPTTPPLLAFAAIVAIVYGAYAFSTSFARRARRPGS